MQKRLKEGSSRFRLFIQMQSLLFERLRDLGRELDGLVILVEVWRNEYESVGSK